VLLFGSLQFHNEFLIFFIAAINIKNRAEVFFKHSELFNIFKLQRNNFIFIGNKSFKKLINSGLLSSLPNIFLKPKSVKGLINVPSDLSVIFYTSKADLIG
jgi:hypothetical protein